jgi:predicted signal transduction protein with EAL and GGDEF domain
MDVSQNMRCAGCRKGKPASEMQVGYAYMGKNTNSEHPVSHWLGDMNFYRMSAEAIEVNVCKQCVKEELIKHILIAIGCLVGGGLLMWFGYQNKWSFIVIFIGGVMASTAVAVITKTKFTRENMADLIAVKFIRNQVATKTQRKQKLEVLTREEYNKLMPNF